MILDNFYSMSGVATMAGHTQWNRFTGSHPINDGDPQNDDPDCTPEVIQADRDRDEQAKEDWLEYRENR